MSTNTPRGATKGTFTKQTLEDDLVQTMCYRIRWVTAIFPGVGALIGLISGEDFMHTLTPMSVSLTALLGGLVTKNAILLVDFSLAGMREGKTLRNSLLDAGVSRLRPIFMTSLSTIAGMTPIALELGADGATRSQYSDAQ